MPLTARQTTQAVRLYRKGRTLREIIDELGIRHSKTLWKAIHGKVPTRRRGPRGRVDIPDTEILRLRGLGWSYRQIAARLGMSKTGVRNRHLLAERGIRQRG